jgi:hypothetical protein
MFVGLCVLLLVAPVSAAAKRAPGLSPASASRRQPVSLEKRLHRELATASRARTRRRAAPKKAICGAFGHDCRAAVDVAWCESRLDPAARNGQYLGLFQMGTFARNRFGHGPTAWEQATAAHRYFVSSGSNWSPWSCKPTHAYS